MTPSGEMTEIFEDGDIVNSKYGERRLEIFLVSERRGQCCCKSERFYLHYCHRIEDEMEESRHSQGASVLYLSKKGLNLTAPDLKFLTPQSLTIDIQEYEK